MLIRECNHELEKFPPIISNMGELQRRKDIKQDLENHRQGKYQTGPSDSQTRLVSNRT